ncbi:Galactose-binding domain-like protein [Pseudohyphozyma bogoriensis]|nr:Galactose-binding domain-like protein [Pseudohyphozyma bogoriensis]
MYGMYSNWNPSVPIGPDWAFDDCAYHSGDPSGDVDYSLLAGCALAIADVDDIHLVTVDNLAVFSVQKECVWVKDTVFEIPAKMPACTGDHCICTWMWEPKNGTGNWYQTPFNCKVTGSPADATPISMPLKDPVYCPDSPDDCTTGAQRPIYYYNSDYSNIEWVDNYHRPGYLPDWGWIDGPQNDIFMTAEEAAVYVRPNYTLPVKTVHVYPFNTDLALNATATASSVYPGQPASAAIDGKLGGYLDVVADGDATDDEEWSSNGELAGAWLLLTWPSAITINNVVLYDRPNWEDHCVAGNLTFSDGSVVTHGVLDNSGAATAVAIANKTTTTLLWSVYTTIVITATAPLSLPTPIGSLASALASRLAAKASSLSSGLAARLSSAEARISSLAAAATRTSHPSNLRARTFSSASEGSESAAQTRPRYESTPTATSTASPTPSASRQEGAVPVMGDLDLQFQDLLD